MALRLITEPDSMPVEVSDIAAQIRATITAATAEYDLVEAYIAAITEKAEAWTRRALITQTWELVLDGFPPCEIEIPLNPLQSITSIKYLDANGSLTTLASTEYTVDTASVPARIIPAYQKVWPVTLNFPGTVVIRFVCGYGTADAVPESIKAWIKMNVASLYENRESVSAVKLLDIGICDSLLDMHRVISW
jgi:uncharacterized phiE125 gp8 family phage protein